MADNGETNLTLIITGVLAALGIGSTAAYVGYKFGQGDGHKEGYADGIADSEEKYNSLKESNDALKNRLLEKEEELKKLMSDKDRLMEYARASGMIKADSQAERQAAKIELEKMITRNSSLICALTNESETDCCRGVLKTKLQEWDAYKVLDKVRNVYVNEIDCIGRSEVDMNMVDFGEGMIAKLELPDYAEKYHFFEKIPMTYLNVREVIRLKLGEMGNVGQEADSALFNAVRSSQLQCLLLQKTITVDDIVRFWIEELQGKEIQCGAFKINERYSSTDNLFDNLSGYSDDRAPVYDVLSVRSEWLEKYLEDKLESLIAEVEVAKREDEATVNADKRYLETNNSIWIRILRKNNKVITRDRWCKTLSSRYWYCPSGCDYDIVQNELQRYKVSLLDAKMNVFAMVAGAVSELAGLYKCKIVEVNHELGIVSVCSEPLVMYHNRIHHSLLIQKLEREVRQRENEMQDDRYNEKQLDLLYKQLSSLTNGGYDLCRL